MWEIKKYITYKCHLYLYFNKKFMKHKKIEGDNGKLRRWICGKLTFTIDYIYIFFFIKSSFAFNDPS